MSDCFRAKYYPDEIAGALCVLADESFPDDEERENSEYTHCLYTLMAICENKYNHEYYRSFYRLLERVAEAVQCHDASRINFY